MANRRQLASNPKRLHLVIVSERTRSHFHVPLARFQQLRITHLTRHVFDDMSPADQRGLIRFGSVVDLWRKLRALKPDLIQGLEPYYGFSRFRIPLRILPLLVAVRAFVSVYQLPFFFHVLENVAPARKYGRLAGWWMYWFARWYSHAASFILYANEGARRNVAAWKSRVSVERSLWGIWGADSQVFSFDQSAKASQPLVLIAGALTVQKGVVGALDAVAAVAARHPRLRLRVVGSGPLRQVVEARLRLPDLASLSTYQSAIPYEAMPAILKEAWVLLAPSRTVAHVAEQVGLMNIEAMLCGTPVIATDAGSAAEFLDPQQRALVVPEGNQAALIQTLERVLFDGRHRERMAATAAFAATHYGYDRTLPAIEQQLLHLVRDRRHAL